MKKSIFILNLLFGLGISHYTVAQQIDVEINSSSVPGLKMKNLQASAGVNMDLLNDGNKLFQMGITGSNNVFFNDPSVAYLFTSSVQNVPIVFAPGGKERFRIAPNGTFGVGNIALNGYRMIFGNETADSVGGIYIEQNTPTQNLCALRIDSYATGFFESGGGGLSVSAHRGAPAINARSDSSTAIVAFTSSNSPALTTANSANGNAAYFHQSNPSSGANAVVCDQAGAGHALFVKGTAMRMDASPNWNTTSDRRLKKDIKPFNDGLEVINKIEPVSFHYNGLCGISPEKENVGIIAQDMVTIAPYMITEKDMRLDPNNPDNQEIMKDVLTYDPNALSYILVNAVKEQQEIISSLQNENRALIERLDRIEQHLAASRREDHYPHLKLINNQNITSN